MNQSIAVSHLQLEDATCIMYITCYEYNTKGKDKVPFAGAVLRCLGFLFHNILYVPYAIDIVLEIP